MASLVSPAKTARDQREFWLCSSDAGEGFLENSALWRSCASTRSQKLDCKVGDQSFPSPHHPLGKVIWRLITSELLFAHACFLSQPVHLLQNPPQIPPPQERSLFKSPTHLPLFLLWASQNLKPEPSTSALKRTRRTAQSTCFLPRPSPKRLLIRPLHPPIALHTVFLSP